MDTARTLKSPRRSENSTVGDDMPDVKSRHSDVWAVASSLPIKEA